MSVMFLQKNPRITAYVTDPAWKLEPCNPWRPWFETTADAWKSCLPLSIASQMGWTIKCPHAFRVMWMGHQDKSSLTIDAPKEAHGPIESHFGSGVLTFSMPVSFTTNKPYGLLVTGPFNTAKAGIAPLSGYVETYWSPYLFTMNWKMTVVGQWVSFEKDEPICMIMPFDATTLNRTEVVTKPVEEAPVHLANQARCALAIRRADLAAGSTKRDRLYMGGKCPITKLRMVKDHLVKLTLRPFRKN